jgi:hypothetical protein
VAERDLKAACCLDSYKCPDDIRLDRKRWEAECDEYQHHSGYLAENLKGKELVVAIAFLIWLCRWLTCCIVSYIANGGVMPIMGRIFHFLFLVWEVNEFVIRKGLGIAKLLLCFWNPMFWEGGLTGM